MRGQITAITDRHVTETQPSRHRPQFHGHRLGHPATIPAFLGERAQHLQHPVGAFEVDPPHQFTVEQERPYVVTELTLVRRGVDLDAVVETVEQALHARPEEDQRIERAQQRGAAVTARHLLPGTQVGRGVPARDVDNLQLAVGHQCRNRRFALFGAEPEIVTQIRFGAHPQRAGGPQDQLAHRLLVGDPARQHLRRQHTFGEVVVAGETDPGRGGQHTRGPQRLGHPLGIAAVPPWALTPPGFGLQMCFDLSGGGRPQLGDRRHDVLGQAGVLPDDLGPPATVFVLGHPPPQQRPVVHGHQRGLVRPVLHQQPGRPVAVRPRRPVQDLTVVRAQPAEHRRVMGAHGHRYRIQLQDLNPGDQPLQVPASQQTRFGLMETLGGYGDPSGLRGGQSGHLPIVAYGTDTARAPVRSARSC